MEITAVPGTEPSPGQFLQMRGKTRSWPPREKGIVYNPEDQSLRIRRIKNIERERSKPDSNIEYMCCMLPSSSIINVFAKSPTEGGIVTEHSGDEVNIFIGRLNLEKLGMKDQFSRMLGQLKTLYIVRSNQSKSNGWHG